MDLVMPMSESLGAVFLGGVVVEPPKLGLPLPAVPLFIPPASFCALSILSSLRYSIMERVLMALSAAERQKASTDYLSRPTQARFGGVFCHIF